MSRLAMSLALVAIALVVLLVATRAGDPPPLLVGATPAAASAPCQARPLPNPCDRVDCRQRIDTRRIA